MRNTLVKLCASPQAIKYHIILTSCSGLHPFVS